MHVMIVWSNLAECLTDDAKLQCVAKNVFIVAEN